MHIKFYIVEEAVVLSLPTLNFNKQVIFPTPPGIETERGVQVITTSAGKSALDDARPVVSMAIREYFLDLLTEQDIESITNLAERTKAKSSSACKTPPS